MPENNPLTSPSHKAFKTVGLFAIVLVMGGAIAYHSLNTASDLLATLMIFGMRFISSFIETMPFLLLGVLTSGLINSFIRPSDIQRWRPQKRLGLLLAGLCLGFLFPVGEWGVIPVARRLFSKGMPLSMGIVFLLTAPVINPIALASSYIAFGFGSILIGRLVITAIVAIIIALLIDSFAQAEEVLLAQPINPLNQSDLSFRSQFLSALHTAKDEFIEMAGFLVIGCAFVATFHLLIPADSLALAGTGQIASEMILQIQAFIVSVSSTGDSALALAFAKTIGIGATISFLSFGAMVDLKTSVLLMRVFQSKIIIYLIVLSFLMNLLAGVLINIVMS